MDSRYHIQLLTETLGSYFSPTALEQIIVANLGQDSLCYQLGAFPHYHFEGENMATNLAYVEEEHARIGKLAEIPGTTAAQRAAFGRLTHTVHDFYAHTNYVDLWLATHGGLANSAAEQIDGLDPALINDPQFQTGSFRFWPDFLYYIPGFRPLLRTLYLRPHSHEAMNLDNPDQGPKFAYAMVAARQRTFYEYQRAVNNLRSSGGDEALGRFCQC